MGRTKRLRSKRKLSERALNVDSESSTVNLTQWLSENSWQNETNLRLRHFPLTGRGVTSSRGIKESDILITVPYDLMITYTTLQESLKEMISPSSHGLKIQDLLTLFLVVEKTKEKSLWKAYLDSLPLKPPALPWLAASEEINLYPADLKIISDKKRKDFEESLERVRKSIGQRDGCVLDENLFKWGYVLVNTRAVYVDPEIAMAKCNIFEDLLLDLPTMALCPFLDMFNHHFLNKTDSKVVEKDGKLFYQLQVWTKYRKYEQIFISYGAYDNVLLLMEYGFFIPGNVMDFISFDLQILLCIFNINLDQRRYKFILHHDLDTKMYVGHNGLSFNLKAVLFILFYEDCQNYNAVIFSDTYPKDVLKNVPGWIRQLLNHTLIVYESDYRKFKDFGCTKSENAALMEEFLEYRTHFVTNLRDTVLE